MRINLFYENALRTLENNNIVTNKFYENVQNLYYLKIILYFIPVTNKYNLYLELFLITSRSELLL